MDIITKAGAQSAAAPFSFILSTGEVDRMGDVVMQDGISLTQFKRNPVALFMHQQRSPIGTWTNIRREGDQLMADLKLAARGTSRMIDEVRSLIEQKILRAVSIGFAVSKSEPLNADRPYGPQRYTKTELLEASVVAVPANASALALRSLSPETRALFFANEPGDTPEGSHAHVAPAAPQPHAASTTGRKRMNIAERIKAAQARLVEIDKRTGELQAVAESVDALTDEQTKEVEVLTGERETVEKNIDNLTKLEKLVAARAEPVIRAPGVIEHRSRGNYGDKEPKGRLIARMALAHVYAAQERRPLADVVRERFPHDQRVEALLVTRAATPVADSTTPGWMAELVGQDIQGFIEALLPVSVYANLAQKGFTVNFGQFGTISVPYRAGTLTDMAGAFVGENGVIPVKRTTIAATQLHRYKMGVISTVTKELTRNSTPEAEVLIQRFLETDTAIALDHALLDNSAAIAGIRPAGLLNGATAKIAYSGAGSLTDAAITDLKTLIETLIAAFNGVRPVFIMNPAQKLSLGLMYSGGVFLFRDELANNRIMGVELITSVNVPPGEVILIDAAHFVTGLGSPEFDASDTATLVMADAGAASPTQATSAADRTAIGTAEQVPPKGGLAVYDSAQHAAGKAGELAVSMSMFQQWAIALRMVLPVSWGLVRPGSVVYTTGVLW